MIRRIHFPAWACGIVLGIVFAASPSHSAFSSKAEAHEGERPDTVFGPWTTADGHGVILIEPCGDAVCGRIVGIGRAAGEPIPKDVHGELQCGLTIITRERPIGDGTWEGKITDPRSGTTYGAQISDRRAGQPAPARLSRPSRVRADADLAPLRRPAFLHVRNDVTADLQAAASAGLPPDCFCS